MEKIRRIVTAVDDSGKSYFASDEVLDIKFPPAMGGSGVLALYGEDGVPQLPNKGEQPEGLTFFARSGQYRFCVFSVAPDSQLTVPDDMDAAVAETMEMVPGLLGEPKMLEDGKTHYTATVDLEIIIEGELTLTLDDGVSKVLKTGDTIIHNAERHAWSNLGDTHATMMIVFIGGDLDESKFGDYRID